jgi:hypothetical protein
VLILIDPLGGDLAAQNPRKDIAVIVRLRRINRHEPHSRFDKLPVKAIVRRLAAA